MNLHWKLGLASGLELKSCTILAFFSRRIRKMSTLSSANFTDGNILLKERTQTINNKIKLRILRVAMNKLGNLLIATPCNWKADRYRATRFGLFFCQNMHCACTETAICEHPVKILGRLSEQVSFLVFLEVWLTEKNVAKTGRRSFQIPAAATPKTRSPIPLPFSLVRGPPACWLIKTKVVSKIHYTQPVEVFRYAGSLLLRQRMTRTARRPNFALRPSISNSLHKQGRIIHCTGCTMGPPPISCQIFTTLFWRLNVQCTLKRNDD